MHVSFCVVLFRVNVYPLLRNSKHFLEGLVVFQGKWNNTGVHSAQSAKYDPLCNEYDPYSIKYDSLGTKYDPQQPNEASQAESAGLRFPGLGHLVGLGVLASISIEKVYPVD